ncbi:hypothetical protein MN608_00280 [Microdochium nivale]|nr:hypothetical protein MN608_00280 [Microdochium nivale]
MPATKTSRSLSAMPDVLSVFTTLVATKFSWISLAQGICQDIGLGIISMPAITVFPVTMHYLTLWVDLAWATRCSTFAILLNLIFKLHAVASRTGPSASSVDWCAFKEAPFVFMLFGVIERT